MYKLSADKEQLEMNWFSIDHFPRDVEEMQLDDKDLEVCDDEVGDDEDGE